ncbi:ABC transporter permease [Filobacillus milosensis]|uniref:ABC transporter permease n=1 Tax=Filobacillus milosensis TaxID=94137 RepID=A0A4Y8IDC5_9BACI|nr:ABC transporter permease [Filobacillus milosensis]
MELWHLVSANTRKEFIELKRYFPNTISMILTFYFIFLAMLLGINVIGDPQQADTNIQYVIVNYVIWFFMLMTLQGLGFTILIEAQRGTLEQLFMSPKGMWRILLARITANFFLNGTIVIFLLILSMFTANQWLYFRVDLVLPIFFITAIGMVGIGFMLAGLAIIVKQIQSFLQILQFILMGLTFVPLSVAPYLIFAPFVKGVDMIRQVMIHGYTWGDFTMIDYSALVLNSIFYVAIGLYIYMKSENVAMEKGLLSQY